MGSIFGKKRPKVRRENTEEFASDTVDIIYDDAKDEVQIPVQETNDPQPRPSTEDGFHVKNNFYEDETFQSTSDDADNALLNVLNAREETNQDDNSQPQEDDSVVSELLIKRAPEISFTAVDEHARQASNSDSESFESLIAYLKGPIGEENRETLLARAIVAWMSSQDTDRNFGQVELGSPRGLLRRLKERKMTFATCYVILCRSAGLSCTMINGTIKAAGYEPGDTDAPSSPWAAVFADGSWRIVHPFWICRALFGHSLAGWVKIEKDGRSTNEHSSASEGVTRSAFQDIYFMPKPENFVHECFPDDPRWELLPDSLTIYSKQEFLDLPYLLPPFFGLGLQLVSEPRKCHLEATGGYCKIRIKARGSNGHMLVFTYELFAKESDNFDQKIEQRMVFNSRSNEHFIFDIRFPCIGVFKLVIYGGPFRSPLLRLCEFKITCKSVMSGFKLLPIPGGRLGFGPGPDAAEAGLFLPSRPNGLISVTKDTRKTELSFYMKKDLTKTQSIAAILTDSEDKNATVNYENSVKMETQLGSSRLIIKVSLPREGEFGLQITTCNNESEPRLLCNYLLSTNVRRIEKPNEKIEKAKLHRLVQSLEEGTPEEWNNKIFPCDIQISNCRGHGLDPSDEDLCVAETTVELYKYKNALREGIRLRDDSKLSIALDLVKKYKNKMVIAEEINHAANFRDVLVSLIDLSKKASYLEMAFFYLSDTMVSPKVQAVNEAVLCLFQYTSSEIDTWEKIRSILKDQDNAVELLSTIYATDIPKGYLDNAKSKLAEVERGDGIQGEDENIRGLYEWVKDVLDIYSRLEEAPIQHQVKRN